MMPLLSVSGATAEVALQVGYSIADITAKCGYGVMIYHIAKAKMRQEGVSGVGESIDDAAKAGAYA